MEKPPTRYQDTTKADKIAPRYTLPVRLLKYVVMTAKIAIVSGVDQKKVYIMPAKLGRVPLDFSQAKGPNQIAHTKYQGAKITILIRISFCTDIWPRLALIEPNTLDEIMTKAIAMGIKYLIHRITRVPFSTRNEIFHRRVSTCVHLYCTLSSA